MRRRWRVASAWIGLSIFCVPSVAAPLPASNEGLVELPEVRVEGERAATNDTAADGATPFTPRAPAPGSYRAPTAISGLGIAAPARATPASVTAVTESVIQDQQALQLDDLLRNVPGAVKDPSPLQRSGQLFLRGFSMNLLEFRRNGQGDPTISPREMALVDRVEFLRGPASFLFGGGQPGGVINYVTRMPRGEPAHSLQLQRGSFDLNRMVLDSTGPFRSDQRGQYRLIVAQEDSGSFREFGFLRREIVSPTVRWSPSADTSVTVQAEAGRIELFPDSGIPALGGRPDAVSARRSVNEPTDLVVEDQRRATVIADHRLGERWAARVTASTFALPAVIDRTLPIALAPPGSGLPGSAVLRLRQRASSIREAYHSAVASVTGTIPDGPRRHRLVAGIEGAQLDVPDFRLEFSNPVLSPLVLDPLQPASPGPGAAGTPRPFLITLDQAQARRGVFLQGLVELGSRWSLLAGLRHDRVHTTNLQGTNVPLGFPAGGVLPLATPRRNDVDFVVNRVTPRAGLMYRVSGPPPEAVPSANGLSVYSMVSQSFDVPFGSRQDGQALVPESGDQWEAGARADLLDGALSANLTGFSITRNDATLPDPTNDLFLIQLGRQRSRGLELEVAGRLARRWRVVLTGALLATEILQDNRAELVGKRFRGVPDFTMNAWTRYDLVDRSDRGLGLGLGVVHVGARAGDLEETFQLPAYTRLDLGVFHRHGRISTSVYLENVADTGYQVGSISALQVFPGAPVNARGLVSVTF